MVNHEFLRRTADGTIPDTTFKTWMKQDYIFVREAIPFVAVLLARAPMHLRPPLIGVLTALDRELEMFRKNAGAHGVDLTGVEAGEKAYLDSWLAVKKSLKGQSPWQEFIDNWAGEPFQKYMAWLAETLDELAAGRPETDVAAMHELFYTIARYEYLFWDMALTEENWPL